MNKNLLNSKEFFYDKQFDDYSHFKHARKIQIKMLDKTQAIVDLNVNVVSIISSIKTNQDGIITIMVPESELKIDLYSEHHQTTTLYLTDKNYYEVQFTKLYSREEEVNKDSTFSVYKYGIYVFESVEYFREYLNSKPMATDGMMPFTLSNQELFDALARIEHSIYC